MAKAKAFKGFDLSDFWEDSDYARKSYVEDAPTAKVVRSVEAEFGVRLPASYLALMRTQNGGIPKNRCFPTKVPTSWAADHVAITGIMGVGRDRTYSLCGGLGSRFMQEQWGYPDIGVCVCDCPSAGHDMVMLDYRACGRDGEPAVVHVDQERGFAITPLAPDFESFVRGLVNDSVFDTSAEDLRKSLSAIDAGPFSTQLAKVIAASGEPRFGPTLRRLCRALAEQKKCFALHADELSYLVYDLLFHLSAKSKPVASRAAYLKAYPALVALGDGEFGTGGYGPSFVEDWIDARIAGKKIVKSPAGKLVPTPAFVRDIEKRLKAFG